MSPGRTHHDAMKNALINASRNQRRFFSSIVAKCTSSGPGYTAPPSSCGPSWVICIELEINGLSRTCPQGEQRHRQATPALPMGPMRPGPAYHLPRLSNPNHIYIFGDPLPSVVIPPSARQRGPSYRRDKTGHRNSQPHQNQGADYLDTIWQGKIADYGKRPERRRESTESSSLE